MHRQCGTEYQLLERAAAFMFCLWASRGHLLGCCEKQDLEVDDVLHPVQPLLMSSMRWCGF